MSRPQKALWIALGVLIALALLFLAAVWGVASPEWMEAL